MLLGKQYCIVNLIGVFIFVSKWSGTRVKQLAPSLTHLYLGESLEVLLFRTLGV